jgi:hypothetical protein
VDVNELVRRLVEPASTARIRALVARVTAEMTPAQRYEMGVWNEMRPFDRTTLKSIRTELHDGAKLRAAAHAFTRDYSGRTPAGNAGALFDALPVLFAAAVEKPAAASALLWLWFGAYDVDFASHLIHVVRDRAGLPGLHERLRVDDPFFVTVGRDLPALAQRFADRQLDDACAWLEDLPAPYGPDEPSTLAAQRAASEAQRDGAPRIPDDELAGFAQRAATYLVQASMRGLDPIGFPLSREVQLDTDPALDRRIDIAAWARRAGPRISPRGRMFVVSIAIDAPWPVRLELILAEVGHGQGGVTGALLRLDAGGTIAVMDKATVLPCLAGEPVQERGQRFERWLPGAYHEATEAWRAWC